MDEICGLGGCKRSLRKGWKLCNEHYKQVIVDTRIKLCKAEFPYTKRINFWKKCKCKLELNHKGLHKAELSF